MKLAFGLMFAAMILASVVVWLAQPARAANGKTVVEWVSDDNPLRRGQIALFARLHPKIDLQLDPSNAGLEKVIVQSIAGVGPDLFDCYDSNDLAAYVKAGVALDVTDELHRRGIDVEDGTWASTLSAAQYEGRLYGVPTNVAADAFWFNKSLFDRAHVPYPTGPWTWHEFIPVAEALTLRDRRGKIVQYGCSVEWGYWKHFMIGFGGRMFSSDGTVCTLDSDSVVAAIQTMHDLVYRYHVSPSPNEEAAMATQGGWGSGAIGEFGAGRSAMALGGRWWLATMRQFTGLSLGVVESPYGTVREFGAIGRATLVNAHGKHIAQAMEYLAYMASPEYNRLVNRQADAIAAFKRFADEPQFLQATEYPDEAYNDVWRTATALSVPLEPSPYVNGQQAERIVDKQIDLVRIDAKSPRDAMVQAAREVNAALRANLDEDPALRARWDRARAGKRA